LIIFWRSASILSVQLLHLSKVLFVNLSICSSSNRRRSAASTWASLPARAVGCSHWCTPGMGVNLWGESPLYMNPVPSFYDGSESTSRRQAPSLWRLKRASSRGGVGRGREKTPPYPISCLVQLICKITNLPDQRAIN
jgi:hypothetical protein